MKHRWLGLQQVGLSKQPPPKEGALGEQSAGGGVGVGGGGDGVGGGGGGGVGVGGGGGGGGGAPTLRHVHQVRNSGGSDQWMPGTQMSKQAP